MMIKLEPSINKCEIESSSNSFSIQPSVNRIMVELISVKEEFSFISPYQIIDETKEV